MEKEKLLENFVYLLFDPDETKPFYVGKGKNKRDLQHKSGNYDSKQKKIQEIEKRGKNVYRVIIGRYETEQEALSVEATLIKWVYGFDNLTNNIHGRHHIYIRPHSEEKLKNKNFEHLDRIDREKSYNIQSGIYTKDLLDKIKTNKILQKLTSIKEALKKNMLSYNIGEETILTAQDPCILVSDFSKYVILQIKMPLTGKYFIINLLPKNSKYKKDFIKVINKIYPNEKIMSGGAYGKYLPYKVNQKKIKFNYENNHRLILTVKSLISKFRNY